MKTSKVTVFCLGLLMAVLCLLWWKHRDEEIRRGWPARQLRNAVTIGSKLWPYHEAHGKYPERLSDLVADGMFTKEELEALRFQSAPGAPREDWIYQVPGRMGAITIESPRKLEVVGFRIIARADGSGEVVKDEMTYKIIRKWEQASPAAPDAR